MALLQSFAFRLRDERTVFIIIQISHSSNFTCQSKKMRGPGALIEFTCLYYKCVTLFLTLYRLSMRRTA